MSKVIIQGAGIAGCALALQLGRKSPNTENVHSLNRSWDRRPSMTIRERPIPEVYPGRAAYESKFVRCIISISIGDLIKLD